MPVKRLLLPPALLVPLQAQQLLLLPEPLVQVQTPSTCKQAMPQ
jgi:hypothetical protein